MRTSAPRRRCSRWRGRRLRTPLPRAADRAGSVRGYRDQLTIITVRPTRRRHRGRPRARAGALRSGGDQADASASRPTARSRSRRPSTTARPRMDACAASPLSRSAVAWWGRWRAGRERASAVVLGGDTVERCRSGTRAWQRGAVRPRAPARRIARTAPIATGYRSRCAGPAWMPCADAGRHAAPGAALHTLWRGGRPTHPGGGSRSTAALLARCERAVRRARRGGREVLLGSRSRVAADVDPSAVVVRLAPRRASRGSASSSPTATAPRSPRSAASRRLAGSRPGPLRARRRGVARAGGRRGRRRARRPAGRRARGGRRLRVRARRRRGAALGRLRRRPI